MFERAVMHAVVASGQGWPGACVAKNRALVPSPSLQLVITDGPMVTALV